MTSYLFCVDSAALLLLNEQQFYWFGQIQTSRTGGKPYSDTSPMLSILLLDPIDLKSDHFVCQVKCGNALRLLEGGQEVRRP